MFQNFDDDDFGGNPQTLKQLRAQLTARKLDGFIVPREDEFQGEYVPEANERLKYLTGFGGSAGTAIVLAKKAAVFVDGRYILQAPQQVDKRVFDILNLMQNPPSQWLAAQAKPGFDIGIDPKLHSEAAVQAYRDRLAAKGARLVFVEDNPLDAIWQDRPALPQTLVRAHPDKLAGVPSLDKRKVLAQQMKAAGLDRLLIAQPENIAWLLNCRASDVPHTPFALSFGILNKNASFDWFIDSARVSQAVRQHIGRGLRLLAPEKLAKTLNAIKAESLAYDPSHTPAWFGAQLVHANIHRQPDPCALPKANKTKAEIKASTEAHIMDGTALCNFLAWLDKNSRAGKLSEIDAAKKAEAYRAATGKLLDLSFDTIAGAGPHGAIVHYRVTEKTNRLLKSGDLFLIDSGGQYQKGTTDVTRTVFIDAPKGKKATPPKGAIEAFTRVLRGHIALAAVRFPQGTNGMQLDTLARAPLWDVGQDFDHGTGHGVGSYLSVHEGPQRISKGGLVALQDGMIVSNEPGYYAAGKFGIRIENLQYVRPAKTAKGRRAMLEFETLTLAPIDRRLIDKTMLSPAEVTWLNAYHARVEKTLSSKVDKATRSWLKANCKPL